MAEARYDELLTCHQDAFADHAAEFWLTLGGDPGRALRLARQNLSLRQTPRAHTLVRLCADRAASHRVGVGSRQFAGSTQRTWERGF